MRDEEIRMLQKQVESFPNPRMAVLPALWALAQGQCITEEGVVAVATLCGVDPADVRAIVETHQALSVSPDTPLLCTGLACSLLGARRAGEELRCRLGGDVSLAESACLGYCHLGPVFLDAAGQIHRLNLPVTD
jgi:NADH:ubiquinone oxidoreductase subunit E